ncbi:MULTISPECIES: DUF29 domain-containing protein [unclassified Endozoicomonas]|uniref:DUF29 domain-containing protein n=1 Tax=unclassified Endozoicomonas TaxID=2644528 RepID=UPI0021485742|nr:MULTISPECIES: DUF29 domain-containing protein [unclassified Endozoicomonas]
MSDLYETDFYSWSYQQAELIRQGRFSELDIDNLLEEVEDMGKARYRTLKSSLEQLFLHALKWQMQSKKYDLHGMDQWYRSWAISIGKQPIAIQQELEENPGLNNKLDEIFLKAYKHARKLAANDMQCKTNDFPPECPWSYEQIMEEGWLPD